MSDHTTDPVAIMRRTVLQNAELIPAVVHDTGLLESTVQAWLRDGIECLSSSAALSITDWAHRVLRHPFPPRVKGPLTPE